MPLPGISNSINTAAAAAAASLQEQPQAQRTGSHNLDRVSPDSAGPAPTSRALVSSIRGKLTPSSSKREASAKALTALELAQQKAIEGVLLNRTSKADCDSKLIHCFLRAYENGFPDGTQVLRPSAALKNFLNAFQSRRAEFLPGALPMGWCFTDLMSQVPERRCRTIA